MLGIPILERYLSPSAQAYGRPPPLSLPAKSVLLYQHIPYCLSKQVSFRGSQGATAAGGFPILHSESLQQAHLSGPFDPFLHGCHGSSISAPVSTTHHSSWAKPGSQVLTPGPLPRWSLLLDRGLSILTNTPLSRHTRIHLDSEPSKATPRYRLPAPARTEEPGPAVIWGDILLLP